MIRALFGARGQVAVGVATFALGAVFWAVGTLVIPGAAIAPWRWEPVAFVFHVSMFYGEVACYAIVATGLGYRATERVEAKVEQADIEADEATVEADRVEVNGGG